jgi:hypothetical protein
MSPLRKALVTAVAGVLFMGALSAPGSGLETVRFYIALPVGTFERDRSIPLNVRLVNVSSQPARVNARLAVNDDSEPAAFHEVTVAIRTPSGRRAAFRLDIKVRAAAAKDVVTLAPGRSVSKTIDLNRYYAIDKPGVYEVRATYASSAPGGLPGPLKSNAVRFTLR